MQVREGLGPVDPYFTKLADAMVTWIEAWRSLNSKDAGEFDGISQEEGEPSTAKGGLRAAAAKYVGAGKGTKLSNGI